MPDDFALRQRYRQPNAILVTKIKFVKDDMKTTIQPILNEFRTGNLMSPAMTALHEQLVQARDIKQSIWNSRGCLVTVLL